MQIKVDPRFGDDRFRRQVASRLRFAFARYAPLLRLVAARFTACERNVEVALLLRCGNGVTLRKKAQSLDPEQALAWVVAHMQLELTGAGRGVQRSPA